jgi:hypothetical protein
MRIRQQDSRSQSVVVSFPKIMDTDPPMIGTAMKITRFLTGMKRNDLLLVGFIVLLVLSFGVLTGYVPSPVVQMVSQQSAILQGQEEQIGLSKLQLYLARESCKNGAKTESAMSRCDRQEIRDAISGIPEKSSATIAELKQPRL